VITANSEGQCLKLQNTWRTILANSSKSESVVSSVEYILHCTNYEWYYYLPTV